MRVIACADLHGISEVYNWLTGVVKTEQPDAVLLAGDLLGVPDGHRTVEEAQAADAHRVAGQLVDMNRPVFYLMGNDDLVDIEPLSDSIRSVHETRIAVGAFNLVGYQYSLPFMGGTNEKPERQIAEDLRRLDDLVDQNTVLVTHGPAHGVLDTVSIGGHAGSIALRDLIERRQPRAHIHGHIHHCFGRQGRHFNVASGGRMRAMLIDLESLSHQIVGDGGRSP